MKKLLILIAMMFVIPMVSANLFSTLDLGNEYAGVVENSYEMDGYLWEIGGAMPLQFTTTPVETTGQIYLKFWLDDISALTTVDVWDFTNSQWITLGTITSSQKMFKQFTINNTDIFDPADDSIRIQFTFGGNPNNYRVMFDKFIITSSDVVTSIKRVEQVDFVGEVANCKNVETVQKISEPTIEVFGTEYTYPQDAKVWLQLVDENGTGLIEDAVCFAHIYTPDNFYYLERVAMSYFHEGIYYYDLAVAPKIQGVYPVVAECYFSATQVPEYAKGVVFTEYDSQTNTYTATWVDDATDHQVTELKTGAQATLDFEYQFGNSTSCWMTTSEEDLTGISVSWNGDWSSATNDNIIFWLWNYSLGDWYMLPNEVTGAVGEQTVGNSLTLSNTSTAGFTNSSGNLRLRITDTPAVTDSGKSSIYTDYLYVSCDALTTPNWQYKRGTNEMHVSSAYNYYVEGEHGVGDQENNPVVVTDIDEQGGTVTITKTISSATYDTVIDTPIHIHTPNGFTCEDIFYVEYFNSSNPSQRFFNVSSDHWKWHDEFNHCDVYWDWNLTKGGVYQFDIVMTNVWIQDLEVWDSDSENLYDFIYGMCVFYQMYNGYDNYTEILTERVNSTDNFYKTCAYYINAHYRFHQSVESAETELLNITDELHLTGLLSAVKDAEFLYETQHNLAESLYEQITMVAAYADVAHNSPLSPQAALFWGAQAQSDYNYHAILQILNQTNNSKVAQAIWEYENRSLTYYPSASVNNTQVAEAVWQNENRTLTNASNVAPDIWASDATISENLLVQIAQRVWNYVARYIHGEIV